MLFKDKKRHKKRCKRAKVRSLTEDFGGNINYIDRQLGMWLEKREAHSKIGSVHSIFNKAINILSYDQSYLFTLALDEVVSSPCMLKTIDNCRFNQMKGTLSLGDNVFILSNSNLKIGNVKWNYRSANIYDRDIKSMLFEKQHINNKFTEAIIRFVDKEGKDSGLLSAWKKHSNKKLNIDLDSNIYTRPYLRAIEELTRAVEKQQKESLLISSYNFIGLGIGLTPSGDDFLLGCLATWKYFKDPLFNLFLENEWIEEVKKRSTTVSSFMLENCIRGYTNQALNDLLEHYEDNESLNDYLEPFLKIGATSGTDMLIGVAFAYEQMTFQYGR